MWVIAALTETIKTKNKAMSDLRKEFEQKGFVVLKQVIPQEEIEKYVDALKEVGKSKKKESWTIPDGVVQHQEFWPVLFQDKVTNAVKEILGDDIKFMQHNDLHYGYSSFAWHRDSINRYYDPKLPDWQEDDESYQTVRCGFYLQPEEKNFELGVLPGSHRMSGYLSEEEFLEEDKYLTHFKNLKTKAGFKDVLKEKAEWIRTQPGDCVIFDPRLIHTGGEFGGIKYSFFVAYGIENRHFKEHYTYYRHLRTDLKYTPIPAELKEQLKEKGLYASEEKYTDKIEGAWIPSKVFEMVANLFN